MAKRRRKHATKFCWFHGKLRHWQVGTVVQLAKKRSNKKKRKNPATDLTDDLIIEILSRLPSRSVCRFKCVSRHWRDLISHPEHRNKLPQTLAGIFYHSKDHWRFPREARHYISVLARRGPILINPSFSFLPGCQRISMVDCCDGLLLCRCFSSSNTFRYVMCNPVTNGWVILPDSGCGTALRTVRLAFDRAVSIHFRVFEIVEGWYDHAAGAEIFSSETGVWSYVESDWSCETHIRDPIRSVYCNGMLHFVIMEMAIVAVDMEGEVWTNIPVPEDGDDFMGWEPGCIGQSQGQLIYMTDFHSNCDPLNLSIWFLEDYYKDEWTLKHRVSYQHLLEKRSVPVGIDSPFDHFYCTVISVHPDGNLILYVAGHDNTLMTYDMNTREVNVIRNLGLDSCAPYFPYVPTWTH